MKAKSNQYSSFLILLQKFIPFGAFIFGLYYFCLRILGTGLEYIPGDLGDSRFINYLLEHGHKWLKGDINNFWDGEFMYPFKHTIALSDNMLGTLPIYSFFRIINFSPEDSYQLWWMSICILNYWISYFVFKSWFKRWDIAFILAWIFAFSIFNLSQLNYMQMVIRFMVPVVFWSAYKLAASPSIKYLIIYSVGVVYQFYCVSYTGFYLFYFSILFILVYCYVSKNWKNLLYYFKERNSIYTLTILILSSLALAWLLLPYYEMSKIVGLRLYKHVIMNLPVWSSYLFPHQASLTWGFLFEKMKPNVNDWWLHSFFPGIIPFLAITIAPFYLLYKRSEKVENLTLLKSLIITSLIITILHIRTEGGLSLYALIFKLPGINSMRVLTRFMHLELFVLLLICGYALTKIKYIYVPLLLIVVFADNMFYTEKIPREKKSELIKRKEILIKKINENDIGRFKSAALINTNQASYISHIDMMLACQSLGIKTINGYSSYCPDQYGDFFLNNSEQGLLKWLASNNIATNEVLIIEINNSSR